MIRLALLGFTIALAASAGGAASPNPKDLAIPSAEMSRARDLVNKLASEEFDEREEAQDTLAKMGRLALPALADGIKGNPSPEVRCRCQSLLPKAAQEDLQARLATFMADGEGKFNHDLSGWNEFRKIAGNSVASRAVFVELLKDPTNRALVLGIAGLPNDLGNLVAARKQVMYNGRARHTPNAVVKMATAADVLTLVFAESQVESENVPWTNTSNIPYTSPAFTTAVMDGSEKAAVYKAIVGQWVETRDEAFSMYTAIDQATRLGLTKPGSNVAAKLVQLKDGIAIYRFYAAFAIARNGAKEYLPALEAVFTDEAALAENRFVNGKQEQTQLQVRDMALVAAILLTGQKTEEYGFVEQYKNPQVAMQFTYSNWRLPEEKRKEAFEKWKAWREKNPDFGKVKSDK